MSVCTRWLPSRGRPRRSCPTGGSLLTLTYFGGERVVPGYNLMGVAKAALDASVKYLAYDLGPRKIRVNAVSAGPVKTLAASAVGDHDNLAGLYTAVSPLGRNITREEVGASGMFLLSDLASGITGEILHVDSGYNVMGSPGRAIEAARDGNTLTRGLLLEAHLSANGGIDPVLLMSQPIHRAADLTDVGIGLIRRGGDFLVRRRPEGTVYAGYWEFPGGKCEPGETPAQTTARECREETGLEVVVGRLRRVIEHRYPHGPVRLFFFDCVPADPAAEPAADSGSRWVPAIQLLSLRFPEANEPLLEELAKQSSVVSDRQPATSNHATTSRSDAFRIDRKVRGAIDDVIDQAVLASLFGTHETVAVGVFLQPLERLAGVPLVDLVELFLHADELFRVDQDLGRGPLHAGKRLVDHDPAMRQGIPLALGAGGQQERAHAGALADAVGGHVARDPLHGVVDGQARGDASARAVDVKMDVGLGVLMGQNEHLGHDQVGDGIVDRRAQNDDAVLEQAGVDIHRPLFTTAPFDDDRNQWHE